MLNKSNYQEQFHAISLIPIKSTNSMNDSVFSSSQNTEVDSINSYFECITECSILDGHQECITRCLEIHLKGGNQNE